MQHYYLLIKMCSYTLISLQNVIRHTPNPMLIKYSYLCINTQNFFIDASIKQLLSAPVTEYIETSCFN
jgi:hypothetical protein